jgi:HD-like signal output (HDOD) protein
MNATVDIDSEALQKLVDTVKLPPVPQTLIDLNKELGAEHPELAKLAEIIQRDAGISGLVLKTVNSPLFGLRREILSIQHAINLLGIGYVSKIVTGLLMKQSLGDADGLAADLWQSQINTASLLSMLVQKYLDCPADEGYLLGLFQNCGQMLISSRHDDYADFLAEFEDHPELSITDAEKQRYNYNHADLGCLLAYSWGIPKYLCDVILHHHQANKQLDDRLLAEDDNIENGLMAVLKIAEHIDRIDRGVEDDYEWQRVSESVLGYLGLSELDFADLKDDLLEQLVLET